MKTRTIEISENERAIVVPIVEETSNETIAKKVMLQYESKEEIKQRFWIEESPLNEILEDRINSEVQTAIHVLSSYYINDKETLLDELVKSFPKDY